MSESQTVRELAEEIFRSKKQRRRELASLPVEQKFSILLELQRISAEFKTGSNLKPRHPWTIL